MVLYARDIVEPDFIALDGETSAFEAAKRMKERKHGFVIVSSTDADKINKPIGIVTEWDYLSKIVAEGREPTSVRLSEIMSTNLVSARASDGIDYLSMLMSQKGIRRVLVLSDDKKDKDRVLGVITSRTILARLEEYVNRVSAQIARLQSPS